MQEKKDFFRLIKIGGMALYIPLVFIAGPLAGYEVGKYLYRQGLFPLWVFYSIVGIGLFVSLWEIVRILKKMAKI